MKKSMLLGLMLSMLNAGATMSWTSGTLNSAIPDGNANGWVNSIEISEQSGTIAPNTLEVNLSLTGGWNGDLYAYLVNSSGGFVVLLDRVGMGVGVGSFGYGDAGMSVTFNATGAGGNIHTYGGNLPFNGIPSGPFQPDGAGTTTGNSGSLSSFMNPNGTWSLFIADLNSGGVTTVQNWGLQMEIVAVPEVETWAAAALAGAFGAFWVNRQIWANAKHVKGGSSFSSSHK